MRTFLRALLIPPLLVAFLGFGSLHTEEWTSDSGEDTFVVEVGAPAPWLTYRREASHGSPEEFVDDLVRQAEEASGGDGAEPVSGSYMQRTRWRFDLLSWSLLAGVVFCVLAIVYFRLGRRPKTKSRAA